MSENAKYEAYKKKLEGICDENNLVFSFNHNRYPITLTIRPVSGLEAQMSMLEAAEDEGYISPDATIIFAYKDGGLTYKISETFTISDALFSKLKNLFKNLHFTWLQYFFRDVCERKLLSDRNMPVIAEEEADNAADEAPDLPECEAFEASDDEDEDLDATGSADNPAETENGPEMDDDIQTSIRIVRAENKASAGLLQRTMGIGYAKAAQIMEALEEMGVVGPYKGSQPREVLPFDEPDDTGGLANGESWSHG